MDRITELLEKYFCGDTSLPEEDELKLYFKAEKVSPEHEIYGPLFQTFEQELFEKAETPMKKVLPKQGKVKRIWIRTFAYSGIAASLVLALWIQRPQQSDSYAVVGGNRIQDPEYAEKYTANKISQVHDILNRSMQPMHNLQTVRKDLQPMHKLTDIKEKMDDIQNKLQFK